MAMLDDVAVAEVEAKQVRVCRRQQPFATRPTIVGRLVSRALLVTGLTNGVEPMRDRSVRDAQYLRSTTSGQTFRDQGVGCGTFSFGSHSRTISTGYDNLRLSAGSGIRTRTPFRADAFEASVYAVPPSRPER